MSDEARPPLPDLGPTLSTAELEDLLNTSRPVPEAGEALRHQSTPRRAALVALGTVFVGGGLLTIQGPRADLATHPGLVTANLLLGIGAWLAASWGLTSIARPNPRPRARLAWALAGLVSVALLAWLAPWPGEHLPPDVLPGVDASCRGWAVIDGVALLLLFLAADRHGGRRLFGLLAATAAASALALAVQNLHCPCVNPSHLLEAHALPGAAIGLALAGVVALRRGAGW